VTLHIDSLSKAYGRTGALRGCSLSVAVGELVAIVGPSGCGKTTLLRIIAGLVDEDDGDVSLNGRRLNGLPPRDRHVAFIMEHLALYPHLTVRDNIHFPLRMRGLARPDASERVRAMAELVGIEALLDRYPAQMSGGQKQRVAVARALVRDDAQVLLADEPFSDLDAQLRYQFRPEFKRLQRQRALPCIFVTHDQEEALAIGDRVAVMDQGKIVQIGSAFELFDQPATTFVARFIGRPPMNLLNGQLKARIVEGPSFGAAPIAVGLNPGAGGDVLVGVRAEELELSVGAVRGRPGQVEMVESTGPDSLVHVQIAEEVVVVRHPGQVSMSPGDACGVVFPNMITRVFARSSGVRIDRDATAQ
jgi:multiple sugar transport system ATP-binding protein